VALALAVIAASACARVLGFEDHEPFPSTGESWGPPVTIAQQQDEAREIAIDSERVYWVAGPDDAGWIGSVSRSGGTATQLASQQVTARGIAVDATSVYWTADRSDLWEAEIHSTEKSRGVGHLPVVVYVLGCHPDWHCFGPIAVNGSNLAFANNPGSF